MLVSLLQPSSQMMMTMQTPRKRWSFLRGSHHFRERRPTLHHTARVYSTHSILFVFPVTVVSRDP